jgi:hypothetical protein
MQRTPVGTIRTFLNTFPGIVLGQVRAPTPAVCPGPNALGVPLRETSPGSYVGGIAQVFEEVDARGVFDHAALSG